jgi:hypothetical protein
MPKQYRRNKNKRNNQYRRRNKRIRKIIPNAMRVMRAVAIANFRIVCNSNAPTNGYININAELFNTSVFENYVELYQYYKVSFVEVIVSPSPVQGTLPPVGYSFLQGNEDLNINYNEMPENPLCKRIRNNKVTFLKFTRPGRNPDFNYWYNTLTNSVPTTATAKIQYRFIQPISDVTGTGYHFRVRWHLKFSNYFVRGTNKELVENEMIKDEDVDKNATLNEKVTVESNNMDEINTLPVPTA